MNNTKKLILETRANGEVRTIDELGIFEGYATVWNTTDNYNSVFTRGSFSKTITENGDKVKILWNHNQEVIGKLLEIREDDHGVYFKAQLVLGVTKANEVYELMKVGAIDGISFGFRAIKEKYVAGIRNITEVALKEISPVIFPANENAMITDVRSERFYESLEAKELDTHGRILMSVFQDVLDDAWYLESKEQVIEEMESLLSAFSMEYLMWVKELLNQSAEDGIRSMPKMNPLAKSFNDFFANSSLEDVATKTSLTVDEARALRSGNLLAVRGKINYLDETINSAYKTQRMEKIEYLFNEVRQDLTEGEKQRLINLLDPENETISYLTNFRKSLK